MELTPEEIRILVERLQKESDVILSVLSKREKHDEAFARQYLKDNNVPIEDYRSLVETTGCDYYDYAFLYEYIKQNRPQYFLELGPGVSSHVIALAMERFCPGEKKLISVESGEDWHRHLLDKMPRQGFVDLHYSKPIRHGLVFFNCVRHESIPKWDYDVVFVDGPPQGNFATSDFLRLAANSKKPITAIIDSRLNTTFMYAMFMGFNNLKFCSPSLFTCGPITENDIYSVPLTQTLLNSRMEILLHEKLKQENIFQKG